ncbi:MAG TPA: sugar phosphate nucleotidyltransferase [Caulobacteraceae bacterium]
MNIYPVLLCGGSGARLWPASRPGLPKAFLALTGARSGFQQTLARVSRPRTLETPIVVAGAAHQDLVCEQLAAIGLSATLVFEPGARDSGPAIAAAAAFIARRDASGIAIFLACDHHIEDEQAFADALDTAIVGATQGYVVTLGIAPREPSTAFGYIRPGKPIGRGPLRRVAAFTEKPTLAAARRYIAAGWLWNSGDFIVRASTLLAEIDAHAPRLGAAVLAAEEAHPRSGGHFLSDAFLRAPKVSIDYAVMEKTGRAAVLPVGFAWSDLGSWRAVLAASRTDPAGNAVHGDGRLHQASGCIVRAGPGRTVMAVGVKDLAIIVADDAVLVCDLGGSEEIKPLVNAMERRPATEGAGRGRRRRRWTRLRGRTEK